MLMDILGVGVIVGMLLVVTSKPSRKLQTEHINRRRYSLWSIKSIVLKQCFFRYLAFLAHV